MNPTQPGHSANVRMRTSRMTWLALFFILGVYGVFRLFVVVLTHFS